MSFFSRFRGEPLQRPSPQTTAEYLCKLLEEQNNLLREMLTALGRSPQARRTGSPQTARGPIRTDKDVSVVGRSQLQQQQRVKAEQELAPWRTGANGPDFGPSRSSASSSGDTASDPPKGT